VDDETAIDPIVQQKIPDAIGSKKIGVGSNALRIHVVHPVMEGNDVHHLDVVNTSVVPGNFDIFDDPADGSPPNQPCRHVPHTRPAGKRKNSKVAKSSL
jgi:hypothetical protein